MGRIPGRKRHHFMDEDLDELQAERLNLTTIISLKKLQMSCLVETLKMLLTVELLADCEVS